MRKNGFTLAEVLITVTIIGVVAALVLPLISDKIGDITLENQRKKAQSVLSNGIKMIIAQSGSSSLRDTDLKRCKNDSSCIANEIKKAFKVVGEIQKNTELSTGAYIFDDSRATIPVWNTSPMNYVFITSDGMVFGIAVNNKSEDTLTVYADVNGTQLPNEGGRDFCMYSISEAGTVSEKCVPSFDPPNACTIRDLSACDQEECNELSRFSIVGWRNGACRNLTQR